MKKSTIKNTLITLSFIVSALAVTSVCTSCQGSDPPEDEDIFVITTENNTETSIETETTTTTTDTILTEELKYTETVVSIELMTTSTLPVITHEYYEASIPMGTQAEVTKPPVTEYEIPPELYMTTRATEEPKKPAVTTEPPTAGSYVGDSTNSDFYQSRLAIAGDSIAYGFNAYGYIPNERNIATESVSMWNLDYFTFSTGMGLVDTIAYMNPAILYISMGMNDVNMSTPEEYAEKYKSTIYEIRNRVPDIHIIVAGITPVTDTSGFVSNETIRDFNTALENMVNEISSNHVYYFDAYSIVADPNTLELRPECTGGDGIHLVSTCYYDFLNNLYDMLDGTSVKSNIEKAELGLQ
ncbi:MAG: SGNH/GDSL hydrolase family protein [Prevotella sp.]|nr:SGNH/GDSL hydrolase family protein [Alistipes senegalensis]MCM1358285.1 SGNH/GDSL hydrolase family protein [Prevotella sp.]MCM1473333.1 SGNH/GDSL hydrolase family protein [Muribaculaceae bacterium]